MPIPKVRGVSALLKKLDKFGEDGRRMAVSITNQTAQNISNKARIRAPVDLGALRQSIGNTQATQQVNRSLIFATVKYAPYVNFGTGGLVSVPKGFEEIAIRFKGAGVRKINIHPQPFLTSAYIEEAIEYPKRLKKGYDKLAKDFNNSANK